MEELKLIYTENPQIKINIFFWTVATQTASKEISRFLDRICSSTERRDVQYDNMKQLFLDRKYPLEMIESSMRRARAIPREKAIEPTMAKTTILRQPVLAVTWDPRLPFPPGHK